jgi:hypothetical protein
MKPARILPLLLLTLALVAPRMASAQHVDTMNFVPSCGSIAAWDFCFYNSDPEFIDSIKFTILTPNFTFIAGSNTSCASKFNVASDSPWTVLSFGPNFTGAGLGNKEKCCGFSLQLGGPNQAYPLPDNLFDSTVTIHWQSEAGAGTVYNQGTFTLTPTVYQGYCTFDTVTASATTPGCDPQFDFHVFNRNGTRNSINELKIELEGFSVGSIRPSGVKAPAGWIIDSVTSTAAYFETLITADNIVYQGNLDGFIVPLRANPSATNFTFVCTPYSGGAIMDRDTVANVAATAQTCSENASPDSVNILSAGHCDFQINAKNYHNGDGGDIVSPVTNWTFTITTPGVTFGSATLPPSSQAITGTWQYNGVGTKTLSYFEVPKYLADPQFAQPGGTIWTPRFQLDDPNQGELVTIQWVDSNGTTALSSGTITIQCKNGRTDTSWVEGGTDCNYMLIVHNIHTNPSTSINAITLTIPPTAGTFPTNAKCFSSSNGWEAAVIGPSVRFTNTSGPSGLLKTDSFDTIHFCIDPAVPNAPWTLSWMPIDSLNSNEQPIPYTINEQGCTPPLVCDSILHLHLALAQGICSDTFIVLNQREGGAIIDSIVITPSNGWSIASASASSPWMANIASGNGSVTIAAGTIGPLTSKGFIVNYNTTGAPSNVQVTTKASGVVCSNTQVLSCATSGVTPNGQPQSLAVTVVPNPMNQQAEITLTTGAFDRVQMTLLDVLGRTSKIVADGTLAAGDHAYTLDVSQLPMGTYYLRIEASGATVTKKLVVEH